MEGKSLIFKERWAEFDRVKGSLRTEIMAIRSGRDEHWLGPKWPNRNKIGKKGGDAGCEFPASRLCYWFMSRLASSCLTNPST